MAPPSGATSQIDESDAVGNFDARENREQAAEQAYQDVDGGAAPLAVLNEADGFEAERGKSGERAHEAGGDADAPLGRKPEMLEGVFGDAAEKKTAEQVDDERAVGEAGAGALLHEALEAIARESAERAEDDQQCDTHGVACLRAKIFRTILRDDSSGRAA